MTSPKVGRVRISKDGRRLILEIKDSTGYLNRYSIRRANMKKLLKNKRREIPVSRMDA